MWKSGLPAIAVHQYAMYWLTHRYRRPASFHILNFIRQLLLCCSRNRSAALRNSCSVPSQPRQPSVTDTPYFIDGLKGWQPSNR